MPGRATRVPCVWRGRIDERATNLPNADRLMPATRTAKIDIGLGDLNKLRITYIPLEIMADDRDEDEDPDEVLLRVVTAWDLSGPIPTRDIRAKTRVNDEGEEETVSPAIPKGSIVAEGEPVPLEPDVVKHVHMAIKAGVIAGCTVNAMPSFQKMYRG